MMFSFTIPYAEPPPLAMNSVLEPMAPRFQSFTTKVTIVGVGMVGMACAFSILAQNVCDEIALVDCAEDRLNAEMLDLQHGSEFLNNPKITASTNYDITVGSRLCIISAGVRERDGESRLELVQRNTEILKLIIPQLLTYSPNTILLIVTNPVDILTYVAWKISGLPKHKVIGSGTNLDSSRFRGLMSQKLDVAPTSCQGWVIGEHGESSVAVWSGMNVAGVNIQQINPELGTAEDKEKWSEIHKKVIDSSNKITQLKGYTSWSIGLSVSDLAKAILGSTGTIHGVSVNVMGLYGLPQDTFLSLPVVLGGSGVSDIVKLQLNDKELEFLKKSAEHIHAMQIQIQM